MYVSDPKINTGKNHTRRRTIHPQVYRDMTDFYDSLRRVSNVKKNYIDYYNIIYEVFVNNFDTANCLCS
jgi:hypothetical protein